MNVPLLIRKLVTQWNVIHRWDKKLSRLSVFGRLLKWYLFGPSTEKKIAPVKLASFEALKKQ